MCQTNDRRTFLKQLAATAGFVLASTSGIKIDDKEEFVIGKSNFTLGIAEAHGGHNEDGGTAACGSSMSCGGGNGHCGMSMSCPGGSDTLDDGTGGACGRSMSCTGGEGACGRSMSCGGGGGMDKVGNKDDNKFGAGTPICGGTLNCTGY